MQLYGVHPPVSLSQHGPTAANPLLQVSCCGSGGQDMFINIAARPALNSSRVRLANAGSATLLAYVGSLFL